MEFWEVLFLNNLFRQEYPMAAERWNQLRWLLGNGDEPYLQSANEAYQ